MNPDLENSKLSTISDANLSELKNQIKKVMIPLLIKIFELKLAAQQSNIPSRLLKKTTESPAEIRAKLQQLGEDLQLLHLWVISCKNQIEKALNETETKQPKLEKERVQSSKPEETPTSSFLRLKKWLWK